MDFSLNTVFRLPRRPRRPQERAQRTTRLHRSGAGVLRSTSGREPRVEGERQAGAPAGRGAASCAPQQPIGAQQVADRGGGRDSGAGRGSRGRGGAPQLCGSPVRLRRDFQRCGPGPSCGPLVPEDRGSLCLRLQVQRHWSRAAQSRADAPGGFSGTQGL